MLCNDLSGPTADHLVSNIVVLLLETFASHKLLFLVELVRRSQKRAPRGIKTFCAVLTPEAWQIVQERPSASHSKTGLSPITAFHAVSKPAHERRISHSHRRVQESSATNAPFAIQVAIVAQLLHTLSNRQSSRLHASHKRHRLRISVLIDVARVWIPIPNVVGNMRVESVKASCLQSSSARSAPRGRVKTVEDDTFRSQRVDVWRLHFIVPRGVCSVRNLVPAHVVDDDDENVWEFLLGRGAVAVAAVAVVAVITVVVVMAFGGRVSRVAIAVITVVVVVTFGGRVAVAVIAVVAIASAPATAHSTPRILCGVLQEVCLLGLLLWACRTHTGFVTHRRPHPP
mmetsp:Transcript_42056/g.98016  ORF Transcript_42056/g.98016 Transcript_42056/m.98016 type:complete len:343 (+) Transcript_42056:1958-2986(+)